MHNTEVIMKNGETFIGPLHLFRPIEGYITLLNHDEKLYLKDIACAYTENERSHNDADELRRAKLYIAYARKYNWDNIPADYPIQEWEI
jgi:hypothetical protein